MAGDPDRGFGPESAGRMALQHPPLHRPAAVARHGQNRELQQLPRRGGDRANKPKAAVPQAAMAVAVFNCPTRRKLSPIPRRTRATCEPGPATIRRWAAPTTPAAAAATSRAWAAGPDHRFGRHGPDGLRRRATTDWSQYPARAGITPAAYSSATARQRWRRSATASPARISSANATSAPTTTPPALPVDDDQGWDQGYDSDTIRWTGQGWYTSNGTPSTTGIVAIATPAIDSQCATRPRCVRQHRASTSH